MPPRPDRRRASGERDAAKRAVSRARKPPPENKGDKAPKSWGGVARRGARVMGEARAGSASEAWRDAVARSRSDEERHHRPPPAWEPEVWVEDPPEPARKPPPRSNGAASARRPKKLPPDVKGELAKAAGSPTRSARLEQVLADAARAYERDRYQDARRILKPLSERTPSAAAVRELHGLTLYRMGRWREAIKELDAFRSLTGSYDQHPVLADCHRALRQWKSVERLWNELREASPSGELVAEGRIVMAGAMADRGDVKGAIALLEKARTDIKRPRLHHLRLWYALADLYERAGDIPRSRELFRTVLRHDHDFADVAERLSSID